MRANPVDAAIPKTNSGGTDEDHDPILMIALLALAFAACKKQEAPDGRSQGAGAGAGQRQPRGVGGLPERCRPAQHGQHPEPAVRLHAAGRKHRRTSRTSTTAWLEKAKDDLSRGIISGNMLAYGSPASAKMADLVIAAFKDVPAGSMKGVKVLFIGKAADSERVKAALAPTGVDYVFVEAK